VERARIRLLPEEPTSPPVGRMPIDRSVRWRSLFEGQEAEAAVRVFLAPRAYVRVCAHAGSDLEHEVGGALAGVWRVDREGGEAFVVVEAALPARHTRFGRSYLTFTHDSLVGIHEDLERRLPGREIVGWYHTHPGMGVFLSGYDQWLHEHFFPAVWQVALVVEPRSSEGGFFLRTADGRLDARAYVGFHELLRNGRESVMRWTNLEADALTVPAEGG
jgi:proteasome lid subunit RPN8/RPN11